jgi:hypothetical protein
MILPSVASFPHGSLHRPTEAAATEHAVAENPRDVTARVAIVETLPKWHDPAVAGHECSQLMSDVGRG